MNFAAKTKVVLMSSTLTGGSIRLLIDPGYANRIKEMIAALDDNENEARLTRLQGATSHCTV